MKTNIKLFADHTSIFNVVKAKNESSNILKNNPFLTFMWAFNWKMLFNPGPHKQAQEVIYSRKKQSSNSSDYKSKQYLS